MGTAGAAEPDGPGVGACAVVAGSDAPTETVAAGVARIGAAAVMSGVAEAGVDADGVAAFTGLEAPDGIPPDGLVAAPAQAATASARGIANVAIREVRQ